MFKLSIIVPTYQEEFEIERFLVDLIAKVGVFEVCQIIVVDSGNDRTRENVEALVKKTSFSFVEVIASPKGRAIQMNCGAEHMKAGNSDCSHYVLFLHCDTSLPRDIELWWTQITEFRPEWGFFPVVLSGKSWSFRVIEAMINLRSRKTLVCTGDQALFIRSDVWRKLGGFKGIPLMEDVEIAKRLRQIARPFVYSSPVTTSSRRWEQGGLVRTILLMWALRLGFVLGVSPERLKSFYR